MEIEGWQDVLENCSHSEFRKAWVDYQKTGPRSTAGKLYKPDAGAIYRLVVQSRPRPKLVQIPESKCGPRMTKEQAAAVLKDCGVKLNKSGGVVHF